MTKLSGAIFLAASLFTSSAFAAGIYDYTLKSIDGKPVPLSTFKGKVVLVVNVASKCGYTPQYTGLQAMYENTRAKAW